MNSVQEIQEALKSLYGNTDSNLKNKANEFLLEFQRSERSWDLIFPILNDSNSNFELKLFICQTLRSKIQYDYNQLPNNSTIESLRLSILKILLELNNFKTEKLLVIQLSIALSYLIIQDFSWDSPILDIINYLSNNPINLLEFLKILPEELSDIKKLPLTNEEFEIQYKKLIVNNIENIYYILIQSSNSLNNDKDLEILILNCIKSWINELPINLILNNNSQLWNLIILGFNDDETFDTSIDCLITIISQIDIFDKINENLSYIEIIYKQLIDLRPKIQENWDDPSIIERFTELYSTTGESWHTLIVKNPENFQILVEIILQLTTYNEDLDIVKYTFKFWYELKSMLILENFKNSKNLFKPIYIKLIEILIQHLRYPIISNSTNISILFNNNKENEDKFKDFRYEIGDVLKDCCLIVGQYDSLKLPFDKLKILIEDKSLNSNWQDIECLLFCIRSMAKEIDKNENKILPQIMNYLIQLPENPKIRYAATLVLGRYTIWTNNHPEFLQIELNYIIEGFKLENLNYNDDEKLQIIIATSHALKYFCMDCNSLLINFLEPLYNLYSNIENFLDFQSLYDIVEGLSYVLKKFIEKNILTDENQCLNIIKMFWNSTIEKLNNFININNLQDFSNNNLQNIDINDIKIANTIELLTLYIDNLRPSHEFLKTKNSNYIISTFIMNEILPLIYSIIEKFGKSSKISERCIKFIRKCIQNFKRFLIPSLKSIENLLIYGFKNYKFGCYLWCSGSLIKEFSNEEDEDIDEFIKLDNNTLNDVWNFSLEQIKIFINIYNDSNNDINDDIVEDFYRMMNDILMFKPLELLNNFEIVEIIYKLSIEIIDKFNEFEILNLIINFLTDLLSWSLENPPISIYFDIPNVLKYKVYGLLNSNNSNIVNKFLTYSIFKFNDDLVYSSIELVIETFKINNNYKNQFENLNSINNFLQSLPNDIITDNEKLKFQSNIEISLNSRNFRKIRSTILDFIHWYKRKIINRS
ncbi:Nuclear import receptor [Pichia californica]|uniref:Nuclear import receptor n=1 Tax=Pichia californica TaxID=460514 RepID=A0A9P6WGJ0_9ASCO|nr:Nuclear import receptor [[Candida] californica]KAG0686775.1 Nuclear import receptor [[Candida] californica]